jgi:argininosuccinate synthase
MVQAFRNAAERSIHYFNGSALAKPLITSCAIARIEQSNCTHNLLQVQLHQVGSLI